MNLQLLKKCSFIVSTLAFPAFATSFVQAVEYSDKELAQIEQVVIAPSCFVEGSSLNFKELAREENFVLLQAKMKDLELLRETNAKKSCRFFRDITPEWNEFLDKNNRKISVQSAKVHAKNLLSEEFLSLEQNNLNSLLDNTKFEIKYQTEVQTLLNFYEPQNLKSDLITLTSFPNRYAVSENGLIAAKWFKTKVEDIAKEKNRTDVSVQFISTGNYYKQPSVLVKIPGTDPTLDGVLVGGHMDTLDGVRPGADDDGSGSITVLETLRTVLNSDMRFKRTLYFAWYAAEEQGLVGSQYVTKYFVANKIPLRGVLHLDMTGYQANPENKIWIMDDYTNASLSNFVADLAVNYAKAEVAHTRCGYGCSDHASWTAKGYKSAMPFETEFGEDSPYIHTKNDTTEYISFDHMKRFGIIGVSFVGEMAEPASR